MTTTTKRRGRPPAKKPAAPRKNALLEDTQDTPEAPESLSEERSEPILSLTLPDLKIVTEALLGLPNTPENVDVYYKIETYRMALKEYKSK